MTTTATTNANDLLAIVAGLDDLESRIQAIEELEEQDPREILEAKRDQIQAELRSLRSRLETLAPAAADKIDLT